MKSKKILVEMRDKFPNTDLEYSITKSLRKIEVYEDPDESDPEEE